MFCLQKRKKSAIIKKTNGKCAICGKSINKDTMTVDHYIPKSQGGMDRISNLYPTCEKCNNSKANKIIEPRKAYPSLDEIELSGAVLEYDIYKRDNNILDDSRNLSRLILALNRSPWVDKDNLSSIEVTKDKLVLKFK